MRGIKVMKNSIENIKESQQSILELVIIPIIISIGINLIMLGISNDLNFKLILIGSIFIILSLFIPAYLKPAYLKFKQSNRKVKIQAALVYDSKNRKILDIDNYEFSNDVCWYLKGALVEDKNIKEMRNKDKLCFGDSHLNKLLNQLLEYIVLLRLSRATIDHFDHREYSKGKIIKIERDNISDFVASNMFIDLFSKPPYEREAFGYVEGDDLGRIGENGEIYLKFELNLPSKCQIVKKFPNTIVVKHPYFNLEIIPNFQGFGTILLPDFKERYMQLDDLSNISTYAVDIDINSKFSPLAFFMNKDQYYRWIDELINDLIEYASIDKFYEKMRWDVVRAFIKCNK